MMDLAKLQQEIGAWGEKNFGVQLAWTSLHGIVEEIGELTEASENADEEEVEDAIGDCMIFIVHFCHQSNRDFEVVWNMHQSYTSGERMLVVLGRLCRHHLKLSQGIRGSAAEHHARINDALAQLLANLDSIAGPDGELLRITQETWERVSKRDWTKDSLNGGEHG